MIPAGTHTPQRIPIHSIILRGSNIQLCQFWAVDIFVVKPAGSLSILKGDNGQCLCGVSTTHNEAFGTG